MLIVAFEVRRLQTGPQHSEEVRILPVPPMQTAENHSPVQYWLLRCRLIQLRLVLELVPYWQVPGSAERIPAEVRPEPFPPASAAAAAAIVAECSSGCH